MYFFLPSPPVLREAAEKVLHSDALDPLDFRLHVIICMLSAARAPFFKAPTPRKTQARDRFSCVLSLLHQLGAHYLCPFHASRNLCT